MYCCDNLLETFTTTVNPDCTYGYISDMVLPPVPVVAQPLMAIYIANPEEVAEANEYTFDRASDTGEETYTIAPLIKIHNPSHECTLNSVKGQDICLVYEIENAGGDYIWRRFSGKVIGVSGDLNNGYNVTIEALNPAEDDMPKYINFGSAAATTAALDLLTNFG